MNFKSSLRLTPSLIRTYSIEYFFPLASFFSHCRMLFAACKSILRGFIYNVEYRSVSLQEAVYFELWNLDGSHRFDEYLYENFSREARGFWDYDGHYGAIINCLDYGSYSFLTRARLKIAFSNLRRQLKRRADLLSICSTYDRGLHPEFFSVSFKYDGSLSGITPAKVHQPGKLVSAAGFALAKYYARDAERYPTLDFGMPLLSEGSFQAIPPMLADLLNSVTPKCKYLISEVAEIDSMGLFFIGLGMRPVDVQKYGVVLVGETAYLRSLLSFLFSVDNIESFQVGIFRDIFLHNLSQFLESGIETPYEIAPLSFNEKTDKIFYTQIRDNAS